MKMTNGKTLQKKYSIIIISAVLLFLIISQVYQNSGKKDVISSHSNYDSYTVQAMNWRHGRIALEQNYPWLELAVLNDTYFDSNSMSDNETYKNYFYDKSGQFIEHEENRYYVSFPPFPSVPMYLLTFFFGNDTPNNLISILYGIFAFIFGILLCRRFKCSYIYSVFGGILLTLASSAFYLMAGGMPGSVWFMAQLLALFLTTAAFYFIHGGHQRDYYAAFILLGFAVGCRPFVILYYFYFAYVLFKKHEYKFLKTIKYYIPAALIGVCYMIYNYVRFGNIFEFGHNYLPEMMLAPEGQFSLKYISVHLNDMFTRLPKIQGKQLVFSNFGFACWITNVLFIIMLLLVVIYIIYELKKLFFKNKSNFEVINTKNNYSIEILILLVLIIIHFVLTLMHKSLGMLQFGSRYTIDILPATLMLSLHCFTSIKSSKTDRSSSIIFKLFLLVSLILTNISAVLNIFASQSYNKTGIFSLDLNKVKLFMNINLIIFIAGTCFIIFDLLIKKYSISKK